MDGSRWLSSLAFNTSGTGSYTINPGTGGTLTLTNSGTAASISDSGGNQIVAVPISLANALAVTVTGGSALTISGRSARAIRAPTWPLAAVSTLILSGSDTLYTGATAISSGHLADRQQRHRRLAQQQQHRRQRNTGLRPFHRGDLLEGRSGTGGLAMGSGLVGLTGSNTYGGPTAKSAPAPSRWAAQAPWG